MKLIIIIVFTNILLCSDYEFLQNKFKQFLRISYSNNQASSLYDSTGARRISVKRDTLGLVDELGNTAQIETVFDRTASIIDFRAKYFLVDSVFALTLSNDLRLNKLTQRENILFFDSTSFQNVDFIRRLPDQSNNVVFPIKIQADYYKKMNKFIYQGGLALSIPLGNPSPFESQSISGNGALSINPFSRIGYKAEKAYIELGAQYYYRAEEFSDLLSFDIALELIKITDLSLLINLNYTHSINSEGTINLTPNLPEISNNTLSFKGGFSYNYDNVTFLVDISQVYFGVNTYETRTWGLGIQYNY
jgi:hypothetical protein